MKNLLSNDVAISLIQAPLADGSTDPVSSAVDMAGYDGCMFIGIVGTITTTGTVTMAIQQSSDDAAADDYTALSGASAQADLAADSDKLLVIDVYQPPKRYLKAALTRATANSVYGGTLAIRYRAKDRPASTAAAMLAASIVQKINPAE